MKQEIQLYDFQQDAVEAVEGEFAFGSKTVVIEAPTGTGKSLIIAELAKKFKDNGVMILITLSELMMQISEHLDMLNVEHSILWAKEEGRFDNTKKIQLVMTPTMHARLNKNLFEPEQKFNLVINDEAHKEWKTQRVSDILNMIKPKQRIGLSATPYDYRGIMLEGVDALIPTASYNELCEKGYLAPLKFMIPKWSEEIDYDSMTARAGDYSSDEIESLIGTDTYASLVSRTLKQIDVNQDKKVIIFANSIEHAEKINIALNNDGFSSFTYHGKSDASSITMMNAFRNNIKIQKDIFDEQPKYVKCVVSVMKIAIGFNVKDIDIAVLCRPTKVRSLLVQQAGRVSRISKGKEFGTVLDLSGCIARLGFPDEPFSPAKDNNQAKKLRESTSAREIKLLVNDEPTEITRKMVVKKVEELERKAKNISTATIRELSAIYDTTKNLHVIVHILFEMSKRKYANQYSMSTISWIVESLQQLIDDFPEYEDKLIRTYKTRGKNIVKRGLKIASLKFFAGDDGFLRGQEPYYSAGIAKGLIIEDEPAKGQVKHECEIIIEDFNDEIPF